jgi:hypothetical protein
VYEKVGLRGLELEGVRKRCRGRCAGRYSQHERKEKKGQQPIMMASAFSLLPKQMLPRELQYRYSVECWRGHKEALLVMVFHKVALFTTRKY